MTAQDCAVLTMAAGGDISVEKAQRFRLEALPYLTDVYTVARYLLRNAEDAEDATQECYLRAFRHFETFRGGSIKPWLLAILRNVCHAEYARRGALAAMTSESSGCRGAKHRRPLERWRSFTGSQDTRASRW